MFNPSLISTAIISLFLIAIILGFVFGWIRGFSKSLIRFFMVLGMAVLAFFVVPALTNLILKADISKWNININGIQVITLEDLIGDLLRKIPVVEDLIHASPTLESFIKFLPFMLANIVLFVTFFFVFKYVSLIIYWIIAGVCFNKKKMAGKDKHKFIGAVIGAVQGLLIACVCFVPVFGLVDTAQPVIQAAIAENAAAEEETEGAPETVAYDVYYAEAETAEESDSKEMLKNVENVATEVDKYTSTFNNTWIIKVLNSVGVKKLSVSMFDKLTTISSKNITFSLRGEVKSVANVLPEVKTILESGLDMEDNVCLEKIRKSVNNLCEDEVFGNIVKEIVPYAAEKWSEGEKFCEISKPEIENVATKVLFDTMLVKMSAGDGENVQKDLNTSIDILEICNDVQLIETLNNGGDVMTVLSSNEELISRIIDKALESNTLKSVMPEIINLGLDFIYKALDENATPAKVTIKAENINWETEKPIIQKIFTNLVKIYADIDKAEDPLKALDFELMGETFDCLRDSSIMKAGKKGEEDITSVSKDLIETLFDSDKLGDDADKLSAFKAKLLEVWDDEDVSLKETFKALGDALEVARSLDNLENLNKEDLSKAVTTLVESGVLKDVVEELVKDPSTLEDMGIPQEAAAVVSDTLTSIINPDSDIDVAKEVEALVEVYDIASQVLSAGDGEKVDITESASELVDSLASSSVILDLITTADQDSENTTYSNLGIADALSAESKTAIESALQANQDLTETDEGYENKLTADQLAALKNLFGITE